MVVPRYKLIPLGEASAFRDLSGVHDEAYFGLAFSMTSRGSLALLWILPPVFDSHMHSTIPHIIALVVDIAVRLLT